MLLRKVIITPYIATISFYGIPVAQETTNQDVLSVIDKFADAGDIVAYKESAATEK